MTDAPMQQLAQDFRAEGQALFDLLAPMDDSILEQVTAFKGWRIDDVIAHLHFFDTMADLSLADPSAFDTRYAAFVALREQGHTMVGATAVLLEGLAGRALLDAWHAFHMPMSARWAQADPRQRLRWAGPTMSARSSLSARLMETWAHAQAIYDQLDVERIDTDRIRHVVVMGVNTFGWTFANRELPLPPRPPHLRLRSPSGETWRFNPAATDECIEGSATEFCQVVTQVRNIADTALRVTGPVATRWMALAQCFAGPPHDPPAPGTRRRGQR